MMPAVLKAAILEIESQVRILLLPSKTFRWFRGRNPKEEHSMAATGAGQEELKDKLYFYKVTPLVVELIKGGLEVEEAASLLEEAADSLRKENPIAQAE